MLRRENHAPESGGFCDGDPLPGVEIGRKEDGGVAFSVAPFGVGEGVGAEMEEEGHFCELPLELLGGGDGEEGKRWRRRGLDERERG